MDRCSYYGERVEEVVYLQISHDVKKRYKLTSFVLPLRIVKYFFLI